MFRFLALLLLLLPLSAASAQGDEIAAAGRGVVRVVVAAVEDGEVVEFGHGSGFAVAPGRVVTNAHVVALATQLPADMVVIGIVPSAGAKAVRARLVAVDPARDLALLDVPGGGLAPLALATGALEDGAAVTALGYPGNVDLATAQSMDDYVAPAPPTRSTGIFSNLRPINGIATLLHTADIARGHSGGPLLDPCGRVLGVNTLITRGADGDSPFAFAVAMRELTTFLRATRQSFTGGSEACVTGADRRRADGERERDERAAREAAAALSAETMRETAILEKEAKREEQAFIALVLLVLAIAAIAGGGLLAMRGRDRYALAAAGLAAALILAACLAFYTRPVHRPALAPPSAVP